MTISQRIQKLSTRAAGCWILVIVVSARAAFAGEPASVANPTWWSLTDLRRPAIPSVTHFPARNPIDRFVNFKLANAGLKPSAEADRRTLIRRLYFDLIGLPPTPEAVESFIADPDPSAYEKLVDRLLASPQHGERWARHWLDLVHYGETHGYDKDKPRPNAWPYRDYVIRSLNEDKPYSRFVEEQLAGDILFPGTRDGIEALGFLASGPWDLIGHEEVPETKIDGQIARHLDRDDMVANTFQTFNSLTVHCAQCHDHKFDPIKSEEYYSLQAVFAALDRTNKKYDRDPAVARRRSELRDMEKSLLSRKGALEDQIRSRAGEPLIDLDQKIAASSKSVKKGEAFGYHSAIEPKADSAKWVQIDLGRPVPLGSIVLHPCKDDFNNIGEGFGFPPRFRVEISGAADFASASRVVADHTREDFANPKVRPVSIDAGGQTARYIRVTATRLAPRQNDFIFALAEVAALTAEGRNAALGATVSALDSIEAPARWQRNNLTDGWYPGASSTDSPDLAALRQQRSELLARSTGAEEKELLGQLEGELSRTQSALTNLPAQSTVYVATVHHGSGNFRGTGGQGGKPRPIHFLNRGSVQKPGHEVAPGALSCLRGLPSKFDLPPNHQEGERRAALARWLTHRENPLTWRSIVNRVWQYHFGRGLVDSPNDFGRMGSVPTHPELLDWLACEFRDAGQSLKQLHRLMVTSATYRQASNSNPESHALDPDNRFRWRQNRRKLEAEAVRDAVLAVAGKLDLQMGGPSFQDFVIDKPEHSPHYEYHLHDPEDPKSHRRSIYRFIVRSQQQPFMTTLDCADPSMQVARRNESVSPLQALALLNNALMVSMSKHFAARVSQAGGDQEARIRHAYYTATGSPPSDTTLKALADYANEFGLENLCRLLFNLNEFSFVD